jgi:hypothetical protein
MMTDARSDFDFDIATGRPLGPEVHWYGLFMESGESIDLEAATLREAMKAAEAQTGTVVVCGRCLDGFNNDDPAGRSDLARHDFLAAVKAGRR